MNVSLIHGSEAESMIMGAGDKYIERVLWLIRNCGIRNMKKVDNVLWFVDEQRQFSLRYANQLQL